MTYSLAIHFLWATDLLITHLIVDIWQNFECGLRVQGKEKYLYIREYNNITNNSKKIRGNNGLLKVTSTYLLFVM